MENTDEYSSNSFQSNTFQLESPRRIVAPRVQLAPNGGAVARAYAPEMSGTEKSGKVIPVFSADFPANSSPH